MDYTKTRFTERQEDGTYKIALPLLNSYLTNSDALAYAEKTRAHAVNKLGQLEDIHDNTTALLEFLVSLQGQTVYFKQDGNIHKAKIYNFSGGPGINACYPSICQECGSEITKTKYLAFSEFGDTWAFDVVVLLEKE